MGNATNKPIIGISIGDLNGIGVEIIIKTFLNQQLFDYMTPVVYGASKVINFYKKQLGIDKLTYQQVGADFKLHGKKLNIVNCWDELLEINPGKADPALGAYIFKALERATSDAIAGKVDGLITAPINKQVIQGENFNFPGHTEYLMSKTDAKSCLMFMTTSHLKVGVVTGHVPLKDVSASLNSKLIKEKAKILLTSLKRDFGIGKPRLAILGLNPHAGEAGLLGSEEREFITDAIVDLKKQHHLAFGPFPADGFFGSGQYKQYDGILAMYHDQGLIPFKALSFEEGVNFTAGLPIVRTSPDHGTGYDLAGKGKASNSSFLQALYTCLDIIRNRRDN